METSHFEPEASSNARLDCIPSHVSVTPMKLVPAFSGAHFSVFQTGLASNAKEKGSCQEESSDNMGSELHGNSSDVDICPPMRETSSNR